MFDENDEEGFEEMEDDDSSYLYILLKHPNGKYYEASVKDQTDGGLILEIDLKHVKAGTFPDRYIDTRYMHESNLEVFFVHHYHTIPC